MLYLAKLVILSNRIRAIFQISARRVINKLHLSEIYQNTFAGRSLLIYFSGLLKLKIFSNILDSFGVINRLSTFFFVTQIAQNRPFLKIF